MMYDETDMTAEDFEQRAAAGTPAEVDAVHTVSDLFKVTMMDTGGMSGGSTTVVPVVLGSQMMSLV